MSLHEMLKDPEPAEELSFERSLTDEALRALAPVEVPADLSLRIRLALSLRPFALQLGVAATALVAVCAASTVLGAITPQQAVRANDIPLAGFSAPRYLYSIVGEQRVGSIDDQPLIVQAMIDSSGRVYDYHVLSGRLDHAAEAGLRQRLLTGVFEPAKVFDEPTRGSVVLTFADVVVRG